MADGISTIDISPFRLGSQSDRETVAREVDDAGRKFGFFMISGHSVPSALIARMERVTTEFFDRPQSEKQALQSPSPDINRGYAPMGTEALSYSLGVESPPDLFEAFNVGVQRDSLDHDAMAPNHRALFHENIWPDSPADMQTVWEDYLSAMTGLAQELLQIFAVALGADTEHFSGRASESPDVFRAINYRRDDGAAPPAPGQMRMGAHTDYGTCTVLHADPVPGLQVLSPAEEWIDIVPTPETFIVNLGDLMAAWTNDRWRSTIHRVVPPPSQAGPARRRSYAYFHEANTDALIEPLESCVDDDHPVRYQPITAGDHLYNKVLGPRQMASSDAVSTAGERHDLLGR